MNEIKMQFDTTAIETAITQGLTGLMCAIDRLTEAVREQTASVTGESLPTQPETVMPVTPPSAPQTVPNVPATNSPVPTVPAPQTAPAPATVPPVNVAPVAPQIPPVQTPPAPVAQPAQPTGINYTLEQLSAAAAPLMDAGRIQDLFALLQKYSVQAITQLKPELYGQFATDLRAMGAKI